MARAEEDRCDGQRRGPKVEEQEREEGSGEIARRSTARSCSMLNQQSMRSAQAGNPLMVDLRRCGFLEPCWVTWLTNLSSHNNRHSVRMGLLGNPLDGIHVASWRILWGRAWFKMQHMSLPQELEGMGRCSFPLYHLHLEFALGRETYNTWNNSQAPRSAEWTVR